MGISLNQRLNKISYYYKDCGDTVDSLVYDEIRKLLSTHVNRYACALLGAGEHTEFLLRDFENELESIPIIDKKAKYLEATGILKGHRVIDYDGIDTFECIIISSKKYAEDIKNSLKNLGYEGHILDIYSALKAIGIIIPTEYYNLNEYPYIRDIIADNLMDYIRSQSSLEAGYSAYNIKLNEKLILFNIYSAIERRDLLYAERHVKSYLKFIEEKKKGYEPEVGEERVHETLKVISDIEIYIKNATAKRGGKDILLFWIDGLRDKLSRELPYINSVRQEGVDFRNAVTSSVSTRNTYGCILEESNEIELFMGDRNKNIVNDYLCRQGFDTFHVSSHGIMPLEDFDYLNRDLGLFSEASTKVLFDTLTCILESKKPVFIISHIMVEPHPPFISPDTKSWDKYKYGTYGYHFFDGKRKEEFLEGALVSALYMDRQLKYYMELLGNNPAKLFFSDHGYILESKTAQYNDDMAHIFMCLQGEGIEHRNENRLIQTENIGGLIRYILSKNEEDYEKCVSDVININGIDSYNMTWINYLIKFDNAKMGVQFNGVRTLYDMYITEATGEEHYYILNNEKADLIDDKSHKERIDYLRSLVKRRSIDINKHSKFKDSHIIYEALGKPFLWSEGSI